MRKRFVVLAVLVGSLVAALALIAGSAQAGGVSFINCANGDTGTDFQNALDNGGIVKLKGTCVGNFVVYAAVLDRDRDTGERMDALVSDARLDASAPLSALAADATLVEKAGTTVRA